MSATRADHNRAARAAAAIIAQLGQAPNRARKLPAEEINELARAYRELARTVPFQIYVTGTAAHEYARAANIDGPEEARRELTELLLGAHPKSSDPSRWVLRAHHLEARVSIEFEGRLAVVTHVHIRDRDAQRYRGPRHG